MLPFFWAKLTGRKGKGSLRRFNKFMQDILLIQNENGVKTSGKRKKIELNQKMAIKQVKNPLK